MKFFKLLVLVAMFLLPAALFSQNPVHFTFTSVTGNNMTIVVPLASNPNIGGVALSAGDEIGVFTPGGLCVGATVWTGTGNRSITVWGDNDQTAEKDGMTPGEVVHYRVWDSSEDIEYSVVVVTYVGGATVRTYSAGAFSPNVASLTAFSVPAQPNITAPADNSVGNALSGNITWDAAGGADDYDVILSANSDFSSPIINTNTVNTSTPYSGLNFNTTYYVRVRGVNDVGEGAWDEVSWKTKLGQVTLVSPANGATGLMESGTLTWNSVSGAANYDLLIATDAAFTNIVVNTNVGGTSYNYSNLVNFQTYYWKVQAKDGANTGDVSETRNFRIRVGTPVITAPVDGSTGLAVNGNAAWTAVTGATKYRLQIATDAAFTNVVIEHANIALTNQNYAGLSNFTNYFARVYAGDADGEGNPSATVTFRTILGVPTNLTPANGSFARPLAGNLTWSSVTGATTYNIQISTNATFTNIVVDANSATTTYAYAGLNNNTQYFWRVRAGEGGGVFNSFSTHTSFTTILGQVVLNTPANNATGVSPLSGTFTWTALSGATHYRIQVATDVNFVSMVINQDGIAATNFNYTNLNSVTTYFWRVIGYNTNDAGQNSAVFQFLTSLGKVALVAPANNAVGVELNGVNFSWGAVNGALTYRLQISEQADFSAFVVNMGGIAGTSTIVNGLLHNKTYYWRANAQNVNDGEGPVSDSRTFQTKVAAPTLLTPTNNETNVILDGQMTWTTVTGADSYQVQVSLVNDFTSTVISATNATTTYNYSGLENNKQHYWRVRGIKNGGFGDWSSVFTFETMSLAAPVLLTPVNGKLNQFIDVTFTWESVNDATGYNFRLASDAGFTNIVASGNNLGTTSFNVTGLFKDRKYYWQVQTIGLQGVSNWSTAFNFTTIKAPIVSGPNAVCQSSQAMYSTEFFDVIDYQWTVTGGTIVGASTLSTVTVNWGTNTSGTVKVTRSSAEWGVYTDNATMNVTLTPIAMIAVGIDADHYYEGNACMNETIKFTGTTSSENPVVWSWDMGDGTMKSGKIVSHVYAAPGDYTVTLTVTNALFCERGEETFDIEVRDDCPLTIIADAVLESCKETSPTFQSVVFGGTGDYSYLWAPVADFVDATVLNATVKRAVFSKEYKLTIFDNQSDETLVTYPYLQVLASPSSSLSKGFVVVKGMGSIDLTDPSILVVSVSGGQAPYIHRWVDKDGQEVDPTNVNPPVGSTSYYLTIIDDNGCLSVEKRFIVFRSASKDAIPEDVVAGVSGTGFMFTYPNPVVDNMNIIAEFDEHSFTTLRVMNLLGEEVLYLNLGSMKSIETEISLRHLTKGFYNLVVETENNVFVKPFIKE